MNALDSTGKKKEPKYYDLSEVEKFLEKYEQWYSEYNGDESIDSGGQPDPPPPPPPHNP